MISNSKILVIEDDYRITNVIKTIFSIHNIDAVFADTGNKAIEILKNENVELIISDIQLPDIDGYDILHWVRDNINIHKTPFIFLTAYADLSDVRKGMNEGADDYITKPFAAKTLVDTINARISIARKQNKLDSEIINEKWLGFLNNNFNHEFLTPLNGILGAATIINSLENDHKIDEINELANAIKVSGLRMLRNTKMLMLYSLISSKRLNSIVKKSINLPLIIEDILNSNVTIRTVQKNINDIDNYENSLEYTKLLIEELINNAVKFNTSRDEMKISLLRKNNGFLLKIENQSKNISSFSTEDVGAFKKFHTDLSMNGLGIGLYVCRELCKLLGYEFSIINASGICTTQLSYAS